MNTRQVMVALKMRLLSGNPQAIDHTGDITREGLPLDMDRFYFDMVMTDGRVYRVRVSDITPEKEVA